MVWDSIWSASNFYKSKTKIVERGGKSAIMSNWCCRQSITFLSTPPSSMHFGDFFPNATFLVTSVMLLIKIQKNCWWNCCPGPSNKLVPQIKPHPNSCQYLLINYLGSMYNIRLFSTSKIMLYCKLLVQTSKSWWIRLKALTKCSLSPATDLKNVLKKIINHKLHLGN